MFVVSVASTGVSQIEILEVSTCATALPGTFRFASLLLNTMIGSTIEPVDGSYDAVISACQKGLTMCLKDVYSMALYI